MARVLVAGTSGVVGARVAKLLTAQGCAVRTLNRDAARLAPLPGTEAVFANALEPGALTDVASGVDIVVSCLGANVGLGLRERRFSDRAYVQATVFVLLHTVGNHYSSWRSGGERLLGSWFERREAGRT